jgi:hypothetical protein
MKTVKSLLLPALAVFAMAACARDIRKLVPPLEDALHSGPPARIVVYAGNVALGQTGPSADGLKLNIGGTAALTAYALDANNRPIKIEPTWTPSKPELIEVSPSAGDIVMVKGLREGTAELVVEFGGLKKTVEYIFIK